MFLTVEQNNLCDPSYTNIKLLDRIANILLTQVNENENLKEEENLKDLNLKRLKKKAKIF